MNTEVIKCSDCPLGYWGTSGFECQHPEYVDLESFEYHDFHMTGQTPLFCPLKKEPLTLSIKQ